MFASEATVVGFFPLFSAVVVPARQAYSHCDSVGRSKDDNPVLLRSFPIKEVAFTALFDGQSTAGSSLFAGFSRICQ
jgi:hypothetical protein